jgi:hypothetical protein
MSNFVAHRVPLASNLGNLAMLLADGPRWRETAVGHCSRLKQKGRRPKPTPLMLVLPLLASDGDDGAYVAPALHQTLLEYAAP